MKILPAFQKILSLVVVVSMCETEMERSPRIKIKKDHHDYTYTTKVSLMSFIFGGTFSEKKSACSSYRPV